MEIIAGKNYKRLIFIVLWTLAKKCDIRILRCNIAAELNIESIAGSGCRLRASNKMNRCTESERFFVRQGRRNRQCQGIVDAA